MHEFAPSEYTLRTSPAGSNLIIPAHAVKKLLQDLGFKVADTDVVSRITVRPAKEEAIA
jgi:hypothetical protein